MILLVMKWVGNRRQLYTGEGGGTVQKKWVDDSVVQENRQEANVTTKEEPGEVIRGTELGRESDVGRMKMDTYKGTARVVRVSEFMVGLLRHRGWA